MEAARRGGSLEIFGLTELLFGAKWQWRSLWVGDYGGPPTTTLTPTTSTHDQAHVWDVGGQFLTEAAHRGSGVTAICSLPTVRSSREFVQSSAPDSAAAAGAPKGLSSELTRTAGCPLSLT